MTARKDGWLTWRKNDKRKDSVIAYKKVSEKVAGASPAVSTNNLKQINMSCEPLNELPPRKDEYEDAITDLHFLYDLLRCEGHDPESSFMKGIKYAHDYLDDKPINKQL